MTKKLFTILKNTHSRLEDAFDKENTQLQPNTGRLDYLTGKLAICAWVIDLMREMNDESNKTIHRADCVNIEKVDCVGCELATAYEAIRILMGQKNNPQRDDQDNKMWDEAIKFARGVLPECRVKKEDNKEAYNYDDSMDV